MSGRRGMWTAAVALLALVAGACGTSSGSSSTATTASTTTTTRPPLPDGACVVRMSIPGPQQGGSETAIIDSHVPSTGVTIAVKYKSTTSNYSEQLNADSHAEVTFSIGHPTANFPVQVTASVNNGQETCTSSFTPH
ncbi:MAG TPA: hypothetical protein VFA83_01995 [Acidimicrobiales bacterium]|nr:hypothetical protein [Acidimicrobiales bacterium]